MSRRSKLTGKKFLEMLMFGNLHNPGASLNDLSAYLMDEHGLDISKQSIDERFNEQSVTFMKNVLSHQLSSTLDLQQIGEWKGIFNRVLIKDSTRFHLPEAYAAKYQGHKGCTANSESMISIQFEYEHLTGNVLELNLTSGRRNDQRDAKETLGHIQANDLRISDLGYATMSYMETIADCKAFFLNRLHPQCAAYEPETGEPVNFQALNAKMKKYGLPHIEKEVLIGRDYKLPVRMILSPVPDQVYAQRIKKASRNAKNNGYQLSEDYKTRAALSIFVTNTDTEKLTARQAINAYRLRWQIELIFKVWKSLGKINVLTKIKIQRFECQLLAKLIWLMASWNVFIAINHWMQTTTGHSCSIWKFYKQVLQSSEKLKQVLFHHRPLDRWLGSLLGRAHKNLLREKKKGKVSYQSLINIVLA